MLIGPQVYSPPPIVSIAAPSVSREAREARARERINVAVTIRTAQGVLWSGNLWVDGRRGATWRQTESHAADVACDKPEWAFAAEREVSTSLRRLPGADGGEGTLSINAKWVRPADGQCATIRSVEVRDTRTLAPGQSIRLEGDGGFVVELRRR